MAKKTPNFGPGFGLLSPNLSPEKLFRRFYLYYIVTNYPKQNVWSKLKKIAKNLILDLI